MNRREVLAIGGSATVMGVGGCIGDLEGSFRENGETGESELEKCKQKDERGSAGSEQSENPSPESIAGRRNCANAARPEPTGDVCAEHVVEGSDWEDTYVSIGVTSYPEPPSAFDNETITAFVEEYEQAYTQNELVRSMGDRVVGGGARIDEEKTEILDFYEEITAVRIAFGVSYTEYTSGGIGATDPSQKIAVYGVDETGLVRAATEAYLVEDSDDAGLMDSLDPIEGGDLLGCF